MAEKKKKLGDKRNNSVGRAMLTPTRSSPRNKTSSGDNKEDRKVPSKSKKTLTDHFKAVPGRASAKKQSPAEDELPPAMELVEKEAPKKRGRKPGPKKQAEDAEKQNNDSSQEEVQVETLSANKRQLKAKSKVNGVEENIIWVKCEDNPAKNNRGNGKNKASSNKDTSNKDLDSSADDQGETVASPNLTYPGDLKCDSCQRTFSNSSGFKRHLKFCMDAEGPPVIMKLKRPQTQVMNAAIVNGSVPKGVMEVDKRANSIEKYMKTKVGRPRSDSSALGAEAERRGSGGVNRGKLAVKEKRLEDFGFLGKRKEGTEEGSGATEVKGRGRPPAKKAEEETRRGVGGEWKKGIKGEPEYDDDEEDDDDDDDDDDVGDDDLEVSYSESGNNSGLDDDDMTYSDIENMEAHEAELREAGLGTEKSLREKMKGVMLSKVNELIDETSATAPGKCHCCGEDLETAHSVGEFKCEDCGKHFKLRASLDRHRRVIHLQGETHACPECDARCPDKGSLARHMYTHTGLKPYSCVRCKKQFSRKYHLERHIVQTGCDGNPKPTYPCQVCGRMFSRKDNLREHLRAHAGQVKRKKKYSCEYCLKEFHGTSLLRIHVRTHTGERPFVCDFCQKGFPSSGAMKKHRRMHTGERPYECKDCFAKFSAKETLNRHARTHTGLKPHVCNYCGKSFIQASQLRAHVFHHTGENGFTCDHCGKAFNRRARLHMHVKYVHEGARPFECTNCGKTFVRKEDLVRHTVLHSGVKAHKCPICEKSFAMKSSLKIHLLTHTKEPPRSCDECGRAFIRQDCLLRHMRSKHREMLEEILAEAEKKKLQQQLLAATAMASRIVVRGDRSRVTHLDDDLEEEEEDDMDDVPEAGAIDRVLGLSSSDGAKAGALLQHLTAMGDAAGNNTMPRMEASSSSSAVLNTLGSSLSPPSHHHQTVQGGGLSESALADSVRELLTLLVDDATLRAFGWPDAPVDKLLEAVIRRCGHQPASPEDYSRPSDRLRENAKLLFTVVIDDSAVKTLLNNQTVDEVILHVLRLAKS